MPLDSFDLENLIDVIYRWPLSAWILKRNSLKTFSAIKFQFYDHDLAKICYVTYCHGIFWKNCWKKSFSDHTHIKLSKIIDPKIRHCLIQGAKSRLVCKRIIDLREHSYMTSDVLGVILTYLPTLIRYFTT